MAPDSKNGCLINKHPIQYKCDVTHPLGYHGHAAATTLGMRDAQQGVQGSGDYPLHLNTAYSIELNNAVYIDEWKKEIRVMLEEDAFFDRSGVWYLNGRQTEYYLSKVKTHSINTAHNTTSY